MKFVILHGSLGTPTDNYFPWLSEELKKMKHEVVCPQLPTPEGQEVEKWVTMIKNTVDSLGGPDEETVFVAHSMSPLAVCHYLNSIDKRVKACFFTSGFADNRGFKEPFLSLSQSFVDRPIDWQKVKRNCQNIVCFVGDNDPYVPSEILKEFSKVCGGEFIIIPGGGHLNSEFGFTKFPLLLETIKKVLLS